MIERPLSDFSAPVTVPPVVRLRYTLQYYRFSQLAMRLVARVRRRWMRCFGPGRWARRPGQLPGVRRNPGLSEVLAWKLARRRERDDDAGQRLRDGHFRFLNHSIHLPDPLDWRLKRHPDTSLLWRFHLHYHEFLLDLAAHAADDPGYLRRVHELMRGWIDGNRLDGGDELDDAWHPYCISRRLPVWILLCAGWTAQLVDDTVLASLVCQARFLSRHLEWDVRGNHLLENLKALAMAGAFFDGPEADGWLNRARRLLESELGEQILPEGEHFERSPMYHALLLESLLDIRDATRAVCPELAERCGAVAARMARFVEGLLHPDGEIPLLGDSYLAEACPARQLRRRGEAGGGRGGGPEVSAPSGSARMVGSYWVFRDRQDVVILDTGPVGPDHLPAHAHSDLLTWEASLGGRRLVVDSGVYHYREGSMRRYCRSTEAHNVLQVDDRPLCDMWSSFRMGYRGWPGPAATGRTGDFWWVRVWHDACRRLGVPRVGRFLACRVGGPWICADWAEGTGIHRLSNWLHLHPDATVVAADATGVRIDWQGRQLQLRPLARGEIAVHRGWYCPELGVRYPNPVIRWTATAALPTVCGWSLVWRAPCGESRLVGAGLRTEVEWREPEGVTRLRVVGAD